jgi:hypothetical protein
VRLTLALSHGNVRRKWPSIVGVDGPAASCAKVWLSTSNLKDRPHEP